MSRNVHGPRTTGNSIAVFGKYFVVYALALILIWIGGLKFVAYEAMAIKPLVTASPLLSWVYDIFDVRTFARLLGSAEILSGLAIALRPLVPRLSVLGGAFATLLFLGTTSFLFTTPGIYQPAGFPQLSAMPGQFLAKDVLLLAAAIWVVGDSLEAVGRRRRASSAVEAGSAHAGAM